MGKIGVLS